MSGGSDLPTTGLPPRGGGVGLDGGVPAELDPPVDDPSGHEFVRPSAVARDAVTFPDELPARGGVDVAGIVDRVTAHLAVAREG